MHRARGARACARASREGRRDESTVNNSGSKLKIRLVGPLGNLLLFPSMGRGTCESTVRTSIRGEKLKILMMEKSPTCQQIPPVNSGFVILRGLERW